MSTTLSQPRSPSLPSLRLLVCAGLLLLGTESLEADDYRVKKGPAEEWLMMTPDGEKELLFEESGLVNSRRYNVEIPAEFFNRRPQAANPAATISTPMESAAPAKREEAPIPQKEIAAKSERAPAALPPPTPFVGSDYDESDKLVVEANHLFQRRDYFGATLKVEELLRKNPKLSRGWVMKGTLLYVQGFKEMAVASWRKAYELSPGNGEVKRLLEKYQ